ncbi:putative inactive peptidyl-prolyl cis-trans isomerase-like 6 [Podochytrium sp. JEL0797]|nr:putative inactive peptidyl-prolyl cis-trans isomerase-like 6 [Podochytrium sp. JEL0797]
MKASGQKILIVGSVKSAELQRVSILCKKLEATLPGNPATAVNLKIERVTPFEYLEKLDEMKSEFKSLIPSLFPGVIVRVQGAGHPSILSAAHFATWLNKTYNVEDVTGLDLGVADDLVSQELERLGTESFESYIKDLKHTIVHMDVQIGAGFTGRLWFELFDDIVPKSVNHFLSFVTETAPHPDQAFTEPIGYKNKIKDAHNGTVLINTCIADENFILRHNRRGNLSFVNKGPHTNYSQFMVTMRPMPYFDKKFVCLGRCLDGDAVLQAIDAVKTRHEKPVSAIRFTKCEVFFAPAL